MHHHQLHELRRLGLELDELVARLVIHLEHRELEMAVLDLSGITAAVAAINSLTASISATVSGDVDAAVAAQVTADQAAVTAAVAPLTAAIAALQAAVAPASGGAGGGAPPTARAITSPNPLSVTGGSPVIDQVVVSAGTIAAATSADGALSMDASGNLTGTAGASGGSTTVPVVVTDSAGVITSLTQTINYV